MSAVSLCGHIPAGNTNPFPGVIGGIGAVVVAVTVGGIALVVIVRPLDARVGARPPNVGGVAAGAAFQPVAYAPPVPRPSTTSFILVGCGVALLAEFAALAVPDSFGLQILPGVCVGAVLLGMRCYLGLIAERPTRETATDDSGESLQRWIFRTESLISWSGTTRSDWDRHVRPVLARQFEMATKANQRRTTDPSSFQATGEMAFGADLWQWVDPDNIARGDGAAGRGPGRETLEAILRCLEQV
ncbi:hypothetical protein BH11ACT7_BH11ACT7_14190 [soil metagenome]